MIFLGTIPWWEKIGNIALLGLAKLISKEKFVFCFNIEWEM